MKIDARDRAILQALDEDTRASYTQLGKRTRINKDTVRYRIQRMQEEGIITEFWAFVNLTGYSIHKILLKNRSLGKAGRKKLAAFLLNKHNISWFADVEGSYDTIITTVTKDTQAFTELLEELINTFGNGLERRDILTSAHAIQMNEKFLQPDGKRLHTLELTTQGKPPAHDEIDEILLRKLSLNARATYTELGEAVNRTPEAIMLRVKQLEKEMILGYKVRVNTEALGLEYYHVFVTLRNQEARKKIEAYYLEHPACVVVMHHLGVYDFHVEFVTAPGKIEDIMDDLRDHFGDDISGYELLRVRKEHLMHLIR